MLAFAFGSHHIEGGLQFMAPLTILFLASMIILVYMIVKRDFNSPWAEVYRHIGLVILAYGVFGSLVGFLNMFDALESIKEDLPRQMIAGGVKVTLLNVLYGTLYFCIIQAAYVFVRIAGIKRNITP